MNTKCYACEALAEYGVIDLEDYLSVVSVCMDHIPDDTDNEFYWFSHSEVFRVVGLEAVQSVQELISACRILATPNSLSIDTSCEENNSALELVEEFLWKEIEYHQVHKLSA